MKVLIACEFSNTVAQTFRDQGHDVTSCDLLPSEGPAQFHYTGDVFDIINDGWDLAVMHPPCTFLSSSGLHWNKNDPVRRRKTSLALAFVRRLMSANIPRIAVENPVGCIGSQIRKADQYVQPYEYGHDASKRTGLWLKNLPLLVPDPALYVPPREVVKNGKVYKRWANQTDSGQNRLPPSEDRWAERSLTYQGIADAMASTWGAA